jgi:hypothetical protein
MITYSTGDKLDISALLSCVGVDGGHFHWAADMRSIVTKSKLALLVPMTNKIGQD